MQLFEKRVLMLVLVVPFLSSGCGHSMVSGELGANRNGADVEEERAGDSEARTQNEADVADTSPASPPDSVTADAPRSETLGDTVSEEGPMDDTSSLNDDTMASGPCDPNELVGLSTGETLEIPANHRTCTTVSDCETVMIDCSFCGCTGVQSQCAEAYEALLDCSAYTGPACDYDCRPEFGLTTLECVDGLCTVVE
jgi:hypothetical protein